MATRRWRINGYDGLKPLMQDTLGFNAFSEEGMIALLQRLVCKHLEMPPSRSIAPAMVPSSNRILIGQEN